MGFILGLSGYILKSGFVTVKSSQNNSPIVLLAKTNLGGLFYTHIFTFRNTPFSTKAF